MPLDSNPVYHVGDHVIVRDWDDMLSEYGLDDYGDIAVHPGKLSFILGMKPFCGIELVVTKVDFDETLRQPTYFLNYLFYPVSPDAKGSPLRLDLHLRNAPPRKCFQYPNIRCPRLFHLFR